MSEFIPDLPEWLEVATKDLSITAKGRIRIEIKSHFADAVEAYLSEGATEAQARVFALADLGDAQAAAKRFRRSHLTEAESRLLEKTWRANRSFWTLGFQYGFAMLMLFLLGCSVKWHWTELIWPVLLSACYLTFATLSCMVARYDNSLSRVPQLTTLVMLTFYSVMVIFGSYSDVLSRDGLWYAMLITTINMVRYVRLWLKVQKVGNVWQKLPPPGATAT